MSLPVSELLDLPDDTGRRLRPGWEPKKDGRRRRIWRLLDRDSEGQRPIRRQHRRLSALLRSITGESPIRAWSTRDAVGHASTQPWSMHGDIRGFHAAMTTKRVRRLFRQMGCPHDVVELLVALTTREGALVQGLPASDAVGDLYLAEADRHIHEEAERLGVLVDRSSDNFVVSGAERNRVTQIAHFIKAELQRVGLRVRFEDPVPRHRRRVTLGLNTNGRVSIPKKRVRKRVGAAVHQAVRDGATGKEFEKVGGRVNHVRALHLREGNRLADTLDAAIRPGPGYCCQNGASARCWGSDGTAPRSAL